MSQLLLLTDPCSCSFRDSYRCSFREAGPVGCLIYVTAAVVSLTSQLLDGPCNDYCFRNLCHCSFTDPCNFAVIDTADSRISVNTAAPFRVAVTAALRMPKRRPHQSLLQLFMPSLLVRFVLLVDVYISHLLQPDNEAGRYCRRDR